MDVKRQAEAVPKWLYRAYTAAETDPSQDPHTLAGIRAEVWSPRASDEQPQWTTSFQKKTSVPSFLEELQYHLKKITSPRETYLVSMTPNLEWAIHRTAQKSRQGSWFHEPGQSALAVIDTHELFDSEGTIVLRVTDIIAYADAHSMGSSFDADARQWAANCDEYIAINIIPATALVRRIPWSELYRPDLPSCLIPQLFTTSYTLGWWRKKLEKDNSPLHQVAVKIADLAWRIVEAGPPNMKLGHDEVISLIAYASDWGYDAANDRSRLISAAILHAKINAMQKDFDNLYVEV